MRRGSSPNDNKLGSSGPYARDSSSKQHFHSLYNFSAMGTSQQCCRRKSGPPTPQTEILAAYHKASLTLNDLHKSDYSCPFLASCKKLLRFTGIMLPFVGGSHGLMSITSLFAVSVFSTRIFSAASTATLAPATNGYCLEIFG